MNNIASTRKKIAMMTANGFNEAQFILLQKAFMAQQAQARIISCHNGLVYSNSKKGNGISYAADSQLSETLAVDYDCLIVVGGLEHIDLLTEEPHAIRLMRAFLRESMPILLISEASKLLDVIGDTRLESTTVSDETFIRSENVFWCKDSADLLAIFDRFSDIVSAHQSKQNAHNGVAA